MKRRYFIRKSILSSAATLVGFNIVNAASLPDNYLPLMFQQPDPFKLFSKDYEMTLLNDKPWNMEAKAHLLDDKITPQLVAIFGN